jgi:hypothetical protein
MGRRRKRREKREKERPLSIKALKSWWEIEKHRKEEDEEEDKKKKKLRKETNIIRKIDILLNESSPNVSMLTMFNKKNHLNQVWYNVNTNEVVYSNNWQIPFGSMMNQEKFEVARNSGINLIPISY